MSSLMSNMSKFQKPGSRTKRGVVREELDRVVAERGTNFDVYFIVEDPFKKSLKIFMKMLENKAPTLQYQILQAFPHKMSEQDLKKGIQKMYISNSHDMSKYIPAFSKIVPIGRALNSIVKDTNVSVEAFYDTVWNDSHFFDPATRCEVFPVDNFSYFMNLDKMRPLDNFHKKFLYDQINRAAQYDLRPTRFGTPTLIEILDPNEFMLNHMGKMKMAWDLETTGLDYQRNKVICFTCSFDGITGYYMDYRKINKEIMSDFFLGKYQIGANLKFDIKFLRQEGVKNCMVDFDTLHAGHCLNEMRSNALSTHAWIYTPFGGYDLPLIKFKIKYPKMTNYSQIPKPILFTYAVMDAVVTFRVFEAMVIQLLRDPLLARYFYEDVMPGLRHFPGIEMRGMPVDWKKVNELYPELKSELDAIDSRLDKYFKTRKGSINWGSSNQLGKFLESKGWPCIARGKDDVFKTNKDCLADWSKLGYEGADILLERSALKGVINTFVGQEEDNSGAWQYRGLDDSMHPQYLYFMAASHRLRCKNPNAQNWPKNGTYAKIIRKIFTTPSPDFSICEGDYAGLQLRAIAAYCGDANMRRVFLELGGDMHSMTAHSVFCRTPKNLIDVEYGDGTKELLPADWKVFVKRKEETVDTVLSDMNEGEELIFKDSDEKRLITSMTKIRRLITLDEFISWKEGSGSLKDNRRRSKHINFGFCFGAGPYSFAMNFLKKDWSEEDCFIYLEDNDVKCDPMADRFDPFVEVATDIRTKFFRAYPDLETWIQEAHGIAEEQGFVRSKFGARRLFPQLTYIGSDSSGEEVSHLRNQAVNSPVQNFEVVVVVRAITATMDYIEENNLDSSIFVTIHDAIGYFIHMAEKDMIRNKILEFAERTFPEFEGIPFDFELDIANPHDPEVPTYWGFGGAW